MQTAFGPAHPDQLGTTEQMVVAADQAAAVWNLRLLGF